MTKQKHLWLYLGKDQLLHMNYYNTANIIYYNIIIKVQTIHNQNDR